MDYCFRAMVTRRMLALLGTIITILGAAGPAGAGKKTCLTGTSPDVAVDAAQIRAVRVLIDGACVCSAFDGSKGAKHGDYVKCAGAVAKSAVDAGQLRSQCKGVVKKYVGTVKALLAYTTAPAASLVDSAATYVRPDGQIVGTGAELLAGGAAAGLLQSGIWQSGDGTYRSGVGRAWTGQTTLTQLGTAATTCNDWTSNSTAGTTPIAGLYLTADANWWSFDTRLCSDTGSRLYCIEQ